MKWFFFSLLFFAFFTACTDKQDALPSESNYEKESDLLVKASHKLAGEPDIKKLHTVALAMQKNRTLNCNDFNNECTLFSEFLSLIISLSSKGDLTLEESHKISQKALEIRKAVEAGKVKLHQQWIKKNQSQ